MAKMCSEFSNQPRLGGLSQLNDGLSWYETGIRTTYEFIGSKLCLKN